MAAGSPSQKLLAEMLFLALSYSPLPDIARGIPMASRTRLHGVIDALGTVLAAAPSRERRQLADAIEKYATRHPTAFRDLRNGHPAGDVRALVEEVITAVDADTEIA